MTETIRKRPPLGLPKRPPVTITHLCAPSDVNGNPRRVFVVQDVRNGFVEAVDEGYEGETAVTKRYPWFNHQAAERMGVERAYITRVDVPSAEYRRQLKRDAYEGTEKTRKRADAYERRYDAWGNPR
jgi:hypothetical protein